VKRKLVGQSIYDLDTPCLLVDYDVLSANIERMQSAADSAGLDLRPHIKAHKTRQIALMQTRAGAYGVTASKISEAEVFASAGIENIFIANQIIGAPKLRRLLALAWLAEDLTVAVDSLTGARQLSQTFATAGQTAQVILEVDNGAGRCGVVPEQLSELANRVADLPGLEIVGLFAYAGPAYQQRGTQAFAQWAAQEAAQLGRQAQQLQQAGHDIQIISGGCTPTGLHYQCDCGLTEIRPGTYCLNDRNQIDLGTCTEDDVAATVLSTVVSTPTDERAICDAGTKALATQASPVSDGVGWLYGQAQGVFHKINDEHGYLETSRLSDRPQIGDKVRIIPPRICTCLNLYQEMYVISGEQVLDVWPIAARGAVR